MITARSVRHPERSEGSPKLTPNLMLEIPHCVRGDVRAVTLNVGLLIERLQRSHTVLSK